MAASFVRDRKIDLTARSNRQDRRNAGNSIRGPQSALTDFLASHNISAVQISQDYQRRQREAEQRQQQQQDAAAQEDNSDESDGEDPVERKKRKRKEEMAIMKIKQSKEFKRRKHEEAQNGSDAESDDIIARRMLQKAKPLPGQLENCEQCEKRFTVTPYSKTGPNGGLLCTKCSKELKDGEKKMAAQEKKKKAVPKSRKRQTESDRMMGDVAPGAKSLVQQCVNRVPGVIDDIDDFGDLPQNLIDKLSQILSKNRVINPRTLKLFLRPEADRIIIHDSANLESEDFEKIFAFMPNLEKVDLRFAGQMKNNELLYMVEKCKKIRKLHLNASNLISDASWVTMFQQLGGQLEKLALSDLNDSLRDDTMEEMVKHCKNLKRLKLRACIHVTEAGLLAITKLTNLERLTLAVARDSSPEALVALIKAAGPKLKTLRLEGYSEANDTVLSAIKENCSQLSKLTFTGSSLCTDRAFTELFGPQTRLPPLSHIDLNSNRDMNTARPDGDDEEPVGLCSEGFKAMMAHSGSTIVDLDIHSCRHIIHQALFHVFNAKMNYPMLKAMDLSFVNKVNDVILGGIFRSCPTLQKLVVFGCFGARGASIPENIAVIGLPNAGENIYINEDALPKS